MNVGTALEALIGWTMLLAAPLGLAWLWMNIRYPGAMQRRAEQRKRGKR